MKRLFSIVTLLLGLQLAALADQDYMPIGVGYKWEANLEIKKKDGESRLTTATREYRSTKKIGKHTYYEELAVMHQVEGFDNLVSLRRKDKTGLYLLTNHNGKQVEVLEIPLPLKTGLQWSVDLGNDQIIDYACVGTSDVKVGDIDYKTCLRVDGYNNKSGVRNTVLFSKEYGNILEVVSSGELTYTFAVFKVTKP